MCWCVCVCVHVSTDTPQRHPPRVPHGCEPQRRVSLSRGSLTGCSLPPSALRVAPAPWARWLGGVQRSVPQREPLAAEPTRGDFRFSCRSPSRRPGLALTWSQLLHGWSVLGRGLSLPGAIASGVGRIQSGRLRLSLELSTYVCATPWVHRVATTPRQQRWCPCTVYAACRDTRWVVMAS